MLYAKYHKMEFRPPKGFDASPTSMDEIVSMYGLSYSNFLTKSGSTSYQFKQVETYQNKINLEFYHANDKPRVLARIEVHGDALDTMKLDIGAILTQLGAAKFTLTEVHSRILLPPDKVTWSTIDEHFSHNSYISRCRMVTPITDPANGYAKTWQVGKRPKTRSASTQGKRLTFYQADKVHPDLPSGTTTMELQLFGSMAHDFIYSELTRDVDLTVRTLGVCRDYIEFKALTGDSNQSRRSMAIFWQSIVGDAAAIRLPALDQPSPTTSSRVKKTKEMLYSRYITLGAALFWTTLSAWFEEMGFQENIREMYPVF